jgi:hypothetical protein
VWELPSPFASPYPLVATPLLPSYHTTIVSFDPSCYRATALAWADGDTARTNADSGTIAPTIIVPVAVTAELNVHSLGFGRSDDRRGRQYCYGRRRDESDLHHGAISFLMRRLNSGGLNTVPQDLIPMFLFCPHAA